MAQNPWSIPNGVTGNERKALQALFDAMKNAQQSIPPEALAQLQFGNVDAFMRMIDWSKVDLSFDDVRKIIEEQTVLSAQDVFSPRQIDSELLFNRIDENAVAWAREQSASLVRNITSDFRESIRSTISDGLAGNLTVPQMASRIKQNLPLLPRDRGAVDNFRQRNFERFMQGGMSEEKARAKADAKAERYANKLTRRRAQTIARTEMVASSNAGKMVGWQAGVEGGYIDNDSQKEWIAEPDACEICAPLDGMTIPWTAEFPDLGTTPPAHPNCRCTVAMLPPDYAESEWTGETSESPAYDQATTEVDPNAEPAPAQNFEATDWNKLPKIQPESAGDQEAIDSYLGDGYADINRFMRYGTDPSDLSSAKVKRYSSALTRMANAQVIPENTLVQRYQQLAGLNIDSIEQGQSLIGKVFNSDSLLSTSALTNNGQPFKGVGLVNKVRMEIGIPAGSKGVAINNPRKFEAEVLLPPNSQFTIVSSEVEEYEALGSKRQRLFIKMILTGQK